MATKTNSAKSVKRPASPRSKAITPVKEGRAAKQSTLTAKAAAPSRAVDTSMGNQHMERAWSLLASSRKK